MEQVFKPETGAKVKTMLYGLALAVFFGGLLFYASLNYSGIRLYRLITIPLPIWLGPVVGVLIIAGSAMMAFMGSNFRFEINGSSMRYFEKKNLLYDMYLPNFRGRFDYKVSDGDVTSQSLYFMPLAGGEEVKIDCTQLDADQFAALFELLKQRGMQAAQTAGPVDSSPNTPYA